MTQLTEGPNGAPTLKVTELEKAAAESGYPSATIRTQVRGHRSKSLSIQLKSFSNNFQTYPVRSGGCGIGQGRWTCTC